MKIIIISPEAKDDELIHLEKLFQAGLEYFHLRKPLFNEWELRDYLQKIPPIYYKRIVLHNHHHLAKELQLKGIHFPEKDQAKANREVSGFQKSSSFHSITDLKKNKIPFDYVFLSPVYNSISKEGYFSKFSKDELRKLLKETELDVIALGGIRENNIKEVIDIGFSGFALLGAIWTVEDPLKKFIEIQKII